MSGHSKWSTIKHKKAKTDAQKGKFFAKVSREIIMAAKLGGADPSMNSRLRLAIAKAKEVNMPNDNIKRAIQRGAGSGEDSQLEEITYEGYGPNGVAILINTLTDNKNRTVSNLKIILSKAGGSMATKGAVSYLFSKKALFLFPSTASFDLIMEESLAFDVEDLDQKEDGSIELIAAPESFEGLSTLFQDKNIPVESSSITMLASTSVSVSPESEEKLIQLMEKLEDDDDVQDVFANFVFES